MAVTTALLPIESFLTTQTRVDGSGVGSDYYPQRYKQDAVFSVVTPTALDSIYGPDGKKIGSSSKAEFVDIYV